VVVQQGNVCRF
ncbi:hypothetical protein D030_4556B, partial [Vibrio parahaemolyticus AQ3810]